MTMQSLSPVLIVDAIEPCLTFWERLGFACVEKVPEGDRLGFVILVKDAVTVMYQTRASVKNDVPALASDAYRSALYLKVDDIQAVLPLLGDAPVVQPLRTTFYGATEVMVREPGGSVVAFAQFADE